MFSTEPRQTVAPKQTASLNGDYPVSVSFDNGKGQTKQKELDSGVFKIVAALGAGIDLYHGDAIKPPVVNPKAFPVVDGKRIPPGFKLFNPKLIATAASSTSQKQSILAVQTLR